VFGTYSLMIKSLLASSAKDGSIHACHGSLNHRLVQWIWLEFQNTYYF
jgi:hypothetical protein